MKASKSMIIAQAMVLFTAAGMNAQAQGVGAMAPPRSNSERWMADTVFVPPGITYQASYYCWCEAGCPTTGNWTLSDPFSVVSDAQTPLGQTSSGCDAPYVINYRVHAPLTPGLYEAVFSDLNGAWPDWTLRLKVAEEPTRIDSLVEQTLLVGQTYQIPGQADGTQGVVDIGCPAQPYYPAIDLFWKYQFHPEVPWISVAPDSLGVAPGTNGDILYTVMSPIEGSFTTYLYNMGSWFGWPYITRINIDFVLNTGTGVAADPSRITFSYDPANDAVIVRRASGSADAGSLALYDALGRAVLRTGALRGPSIAVGTQQLVAGIYTCIWQQPAGKSFASGKVMITK